MNALGVSLIEFVLSSRGHTLWLEYHSGQYVPAVPKLNKTLTLMSDVKVKSITFEPFARGTLAVQAFRTVQSSGRTKRFFECSSMCVKLRGAASKSVRLIIRFPEKCASGRIQNAGMVQCV